MSVTHGGRALHAVVALFFERDLDDARGHVGVVFRSGIRDDLDFQDILCFQVLQIGKQVFARFPQQTVVYHHAGAFASVDRYLPFFTDPDTRRQRHDLFAVASDSQRSVGQIDYETVCFTGDDITGHHNFIERDGGRVHRQIAQVCIGVQFDLSFEIFVSHERYFQPVVSPGQSDFESPLIVSDRAVRFCGILYRTYRYGGIVDYRPFVIDGAAFQCQVGCILGLCPWRRNRQCGGQQDGEQ